tara:strand:+ start:1401 stop:2516 length:1116 start_codon:yes stop_codon:yes gene_type:complete
MYFKNAKFYLLTKHVDFSGLTQALENIPFHPCGDHTMATLGFSPVIGSLLVHEVNGFYTVKLLKESKIIPARVVAREVEVRAKILEAETGAPLGKKARADLKEQVVSQLLPRAFTDQTATMGTIIPSHKLIIVNASSDGEAEIFLAVLRKALGSLPIVPFARRSLASDLTSWLVNGHPTQFELLEETELQATDETKAVIRAKNQELNSEEIQLCLDSGKLVQKLAVSYDEQLTAVLVEDGSVKRIKYSDRLIEESADIPKDQQEARLDSEIFLGANGLLSLALSLKEAFHLDDDEVLSHEIKLPCDPEPEPEDVFYEEAKAFVIETRKANVSTLQRKFRIGYSRAARLVEALEHEGVVSALNSYGHREVLM